MNRSMKYLTPKTLITEIERQRAEEAEEQNIDLYEAIAGLFEEVVGLTEKVSSPSPSIWRRRRKALSIRRGNAQGTPAEGP